MKNREVSKRYALALSNLIGSSDISVIEEQFFSIYSSLKKSNKINNFFFSKKITTEKKKKIFQASLGQKLHPTLIKFFMLILDKRREELIYTIYDEFLNFNDLKLNRWQVDICLAKKELQTDDLENKIKAFLLEHIHIFSDATSNSQKDSNIILNYKIKPNIIGGIQIQTNDRLLDKSTYNRLLKWQERITYNKINVDQLITE